MRLTIRLFIHLLLFLFICFVSATTVSGQNNDFQHKKDSILQVIASAKGEEKLKAYDTLLHLIENYQPSELDLMLQYANDFLCEARKQQNEKYEALACFSELSYLWNFWRFNEFEQKANEYLPLLKKNNLNYYYQTYNILISHQFQSEQVSVDYVLKKLKQIYAEATKENHLFGIASISGTLTKMYIKMGYYEDAERYAKETIEKGFELVKKKPGFYEYATVSSGYFFLAYALLEQKKINELRAVVFDWKKHMTDCKRKIGRDDTHLAMYFMYNAYICLDQRKINKAELYCDSMQPIAVPMEEHYIWRLKASIYEYRNEFENTIGYIDKLIDNTLKFEKIRFMKDKARILGKMGRLEEAHAIYNEIIHLNDSLQRIENNLQLHEVRMEYEVDKLVAEKERQRIIIFSLIGGCILLAISLVIWMYFSRKIDRKNRSLALQIKELTAQQEEQTNEMPAETFFETETENPEDVDNNLCVENRLDKLCIAVRNFLHKDKVYRDSSITQEFIIKKLKTNRHIFAEAMESCLKMKFIDYLNLLRLKDAAQLLEQSEQSIEVISKIAGFGTVQNFRRQFNDKYNMTPKDYRNSIKKQ